MIASIPQPGLTGKTVVVLDAGDGHGPAVCGSLIASGVSVIATGSAAELPTPLVDAGTGLPGELHYRPLATPDAWTAVAEWIGAHAGKIHGIVGAPDLVTPAAAALASHLAASATIVAVGLETAPIAGPRPDIRSNAIVLAGGRGSRHEDAGNAVAFLLSDLAELVDGAVIPIGERPANAI
jgi:hypothetical protein